MAQFRDVTARHAWRYDYDREAGWRWFFAPFIPGFIPVGTRYEEAFEAALDWAMAEFGAERRGFHWKVVAGHHAFAFKDAALAAAFKLRWC